MVDAPNLFGDAGGFPFQELSEERRHRDLAEASRRQAMSEVAQWQERYSTLQQQLGSNVWPTSKVFVLSKMPGVFVLVYKNKLFWKGGDRWLGMDDVLLMMLLLLLLLLLLFVVFQRFLFLTVKLLKSFSFQTIFILVDLGCVWKCGKNPLNPFFRYPSKHVFFKCVLGLVIQSCLVLVPIL